MRDLLKDRNYFEDRYSRDVKRLNNACLEYEEILRTKGENFSGLNMCHLDIIIKYQFKFYSGYSLGLSRQELEKDIPILIESMLKSWNGTSYGDMEFLLSLAIIFDIDKNTMEPVVDLLIKNNYKDFVLDSMAKYIIPSFEVRTDKLKFNRSSKSLAETIILANENAESSILKLKHYLDKEWLKLQKEGAISNQDHLSKDKYRGYWCIEAPALVKMFGLDETQLKSSKYYPYDLLN